eukprot:1038820-Rhodomonas_salina.1
MPVCSYTMPLVRASVSSYGLPGTVVLYAPTRCPVLLCCTPLRACYAMSGTDTACVVLGRCDVVHVDGGHFDFVPWNDLIELAKSVSFFFLFSSFSLPPSLPSLHTTCLVPALYGRRRCA